MNYVSVYLRIVHPGQFCFRRNKCSHSVVDNGLEVEPQGVHVYVGALTEFTKTGKFVSQMRDNSSVICPTKTQDACTRTMIWHSSLKWQCKHCHFVIREPPATWTFGWTLRRQSLTNVKLRTLLHDSYTRVRVVTVWTRLKFNIRSSRACATLGRVEHVHCPYLVPLFAVWSSLLPLS